MLSNRTDSTDEPTGSTDWAAFVPAAGRAALASFRTWPAVIARETETGIWIRSSSLDESRSAELKERLRTQVGAELFDVLPGQALVPRGLSVPTARLPEGPWQPLRDITAIAWPAMSRAAGTAAKCPIRLVRGGSESEPTLLELDLAAWARLVPSIPQVRLAQWDFAASSDGRVLVRGTPLPSIPGIRVCGRDGVLIPAGFCWEPDVSPAVLRRLLRVPNDDLVLWRAETDAWQRIPQEAFVPARRANVRQTLLELASSRSDP